MQLKRRKEYSCNANCTHMQKRMTGSYKLHYCQNMCKCVLSTTQSCVCIRKAIMKISTERQAVDNKEKLILMKNTKGWQYLAYTRSTEKQEGMTELGIKALINMYIN